MFNLVGKKLRFSAFKTLGVHRLFPRSLCSSPATSDYSFAASYLIDSCGFPPDKAISASRYLKFKTSDRADSVLAFFKKQRFTGAQISHLVRKFPLALTCHPEKNLLPKFEFLISIGLSASDIVKILSANPNPLGRSLKNQIEPTYNLLGDLLQSNDRTVGVIKRYPRVLDWDLQASLIPNIQILRDVGVPGSKMLNALTYYPRDFVVATEEFKKVVEEVVEMGFDPEKSNFISALHAIRYMSRSIWDKKMEAYKKWGWSEAQIFLAFRANPLCMMKSEEKIDKVMDYLVNNMGFDTSNIAKNSVLISYSMEKRIIPRCLVYKYCLENDLMKDKNYCGFISWLKCSESMFKKRLERYEKEAPGVMNFYREKLDNAK